MNTKGLDHIGLVGRLRTVWNNRDRLYAFKTGEHYSWFRKSDRPPVPSDELGPYRFFPVTLSGEIFATSGQINANIARVLGLSALTERAWADRGTVSIQNIFAY